MTQVIAVRDLIHKKDQEGSPNSPVDCLGIGDPIKGSPMRRARMREPHLGKGFGENPARVVPESYRSAQGPSERTRQRSRARGDRDTKVKAPAIAPPLGEGLGRVFPTLKDPQPPCLRYNLPSKGFRSLKQAKAFFDK